MKAHPVCTFLPSAWHPRGIPHGRVAEACVYEKRISVFFFFKRLNIDTGFLICLHITPATELKENQPRWYFSALQKQGLGSLWTMCPLAHPCLWTVTPAHLWGFQDITVYLSSCNILKLQTVEITPVNTFLSAPKAMWLLKMLRLAVYDGGEWVRKWGTLSSTGFLSVENSYTYICLIYFLFLINIPVWHYRESGTHHPLHWNLMKPRIWKQQSQSHHAHSFSEFFPFVPNHVGAPGHTQEQQPSWEIRR